MGLYLLNISVDTADPSPEHLPEDLSFNDQESLVELVVEMIFGFENAIKEYDDHDTEEHNNKKNLKIDLVVHFSNSKNEDHLQLIKRNNLCRDYVARLTQGFNQLDGQPPKV